MKELLFIVDMVNGFVKEGSMHDAKIMDIVEVIQKECETHEDRLFIADTHEEEAMEFRSFPPHCIKEVLEKNSTNTFHVLNKAILKDYDSFKIVGCCSDICVMQLALSLKTYLNQMNMTQPVRVVEKGIATYDAPYHPAKQYHQIALQLMEQAGIMIE